jgi:septin family protein
MTDRTDSGKGKIRFNILTVGQRSTGRATFLRSLLRNYGVDDLRLIRGMTSPEKRQYQKVDDVLKPDKVRIAEVGRSVIATADNNKLDLVLYDSLGYGDFINNQDAVETIRNYVLEKHACWRGLDMQVSHQIDFLSV